jgi:LuxR family maltose regulon positive regulatory protein
MPKAVTCTLTWLEDAGTYTLRHQGSINPRFLHVEDEHSFILLVEDSSFAFQGKNGHLTLRKERRQHGGGYWYAYRNQGHRTFKKYVGRTADMTIARLEAIAEALTAEFVASTPASLPG